MGRLNNNYCFYLRLGIPFVFKNYPLQNSSYNVKHIYLNNKLSLKSLKYTQVQQVLEYFLKLIYLFQLCSRKRSMRYVEMKLGCT